MTVAKDLDVSEQGETPSWAWPVYAIVAWLATILDYIGRFKRIRHTHTFKANWRDNWAGLRESEWHRDQLIAQGVAQLLAGQPLQPDDTKIQLTPPASYGGPCPRSPFDMNRRFLALARWAADPEAFVRARFRRILGCPLRRAARATSPALRAEEESNRARGMRRRLSSSGDSRGRWRATSSSRDGGGSRRLSLNAQPRAPPSPRPSTASCPAGPRQRERDRMSLAIRLPLCHPHSAH